MAHFYGYLTGNRGTATRCGSKNSGIQSHLRSWSNDVIVSLRADEKAVDVLNLTIPKGLRIVLLDLINETKANEEFLG